MSVVPTNEYLSKSWTNWTTERWVVDPTKQGKMEK